MASDATLCGEIVGLNLPSSIERRHMTLNYLNSNQSVDYRIWLQNHFDVRTKRNARYSLRAFARLLEIDPSSLSQILAGRRGVSLKLLNKFCTRLGVSPDEVARVTQGYLLKVTGAFPPKMNDDYHQLSLDTFAIISEWYHYAILELTFVKGFSSKPQWIAKMLGISVQETKTAIERLQRLDLLEEKNGKLKKTKSFLTNFSDGITSSALKHFQRQVLQKALESIDVVPQDFKDITSITFPMDLKNMGAAREKIKAFRREMCASLENGEPTAVYNLAIQLYPISKSIGELK